MVMTAISTEIVLQKFNGMLKSLVKNETVAVGKYNNSQHTNR